MKKILSLSLALFLLAGTCFALAEQEAPTAFSMSCRNVNANFDWDSDALYRLITDKFNLDIDIWAVDAAAQNETASVWILGGTMPDVLMWPNFDYPTYMSYIEQNLVRALPDGWETDYPNLYHMVQKTGLAEYINVDGKTYGIPHATFCNFAEMEKIVNHVSIYYRADWLKELGMEPWGPSVSISEFAEYLRGCIARDFAGNGNTIGLTTEESRLISYAMMFTGEQYNGFNATEDGYVWGPCSENVIPVIAALREYYNEGLIDPDYYLLSDTDAMGVFYSGNAAALIYSGSCSGIVQIVDAFRQANPDAGDGYAAVSMVTLTDDDGQAYAQETTNYWTMSLFSPATDDATMARILTMIDWLCTREGQLVTQLGIEGTDWEYDAEGNLVSLTNQTAITAYPSFYPFNYISILSDDFSFVSPAYDSRAQDIVSSIYAAKQQGTVIPYNYDYAFYTSSAKEMYSVDIDSAVSNLLLTDADIETEWTAFIEQYRPMVDPLIEELNAAFPVE